ncbi:M28 family peptidase [Streptomyces sp. yr375]|uniref:M28 family peptidase n=1 Tax=Streptomyces sp. yr375 TaxID=1761906 RepID=UPI000B818B2A|nr:M28 family peptidase [Streptomyces sp. yr375]
MAAVAAAVLSIPLLLGSAPPVAARKGDPGREAARLSKALVREASAKGAFKYLRKFQQLADSTGGDRVAGSPGHDASAAYVHKLLRKAGYRVSYQKFDFVYTQTQAERLSVLSPAPADVQIRALTYTKSTPVGGITASVAAVPVDADGTTGCEPGDYAAGGFAGKIALIRRGGCSFAAKQEQAAAAGAVGAVIYNNIDAGYGPLSGTLSDPANAKIPTGGISKADGEKLAADAARGPVSISFEIRQFQEPRSTNNVIAETPGGDPAHTVMFGAQLDTVPGSPGINDDGSGSAALLDVALKLAKKEKHPHNKVRFAWWSATESGLVGSDYYVAHLTPAARQDVKLYLHFEMIASPNYGLFVLDGDGSDGANTQTVPDGSAQLERDITQFLGHRRLPYEGTPFVSRFDYAPFVDAGIPSGGTFSGAEAIKTPAQAAEFGGTAGVAFDVNYQTARDTLENINMTALGINSDVIANAVGAYAHDLSSLDTLNTFGSHGSHGSADDSPRDSRGLTG